MERFVHVVAERMHRAVAVRHVKRDGMGTAKAPRVIDPFAILRRPQAVCEADHISFVAAVDALVVAERGSVFILIRIEILLADQVAQRRPVGDVGKADQLVIGNNPRVRLVPDVAAVGPGRQRSRSANKPFAKVFSGVGRVVRTGGEGDGR